MGWGVLEQKLKEVPKINFPRGLTKKAKEALIKVCTELLDRQKRLAKHEIMLKENEECFKLLSAAPKKNK